MSIVFRLIVVAGCFRFIKCTTVEVLSTEDDKANSAVLIDDTNMYADWSGKYEHTPKHNNLQAGENSEEDTTDNPDYNDTTDKNNTADNYAKEIVRGSYSEFSATNPHYSYPSKFPNLGRRNIPASVTSTKGKEIEFVKAPPAMVLAIDMASRLAHNKNTKPSDYPIKGNALRNGDFWDSVWEQPVDPKMLRNNPEMDFWESMWEQSIEAKLLRKNPEMGRSMRPVKVPKTKKLSTVKVKVEPESKIHDLIMGLKRISPKLLYVINTGRE